MLDRANLLIVDDHEPNLLAFRAVLEALEGVEIFTARSGPEALKHAAANDFAVVLLDIQMAGMDGFETAAALKQNERSRVTPIIFLTANAVDSQRLRGYQQGAVDFLFKPVDTDVLRSKVSVFVELFRAREVVKQQAARLSERERDDARRALQRSDDRLANVLAALSEGIVVYSRDGQIEFINDAATRLLGLTREELSGRKLADPRWKTIHENGEAMPPDEVPVVVATRTGKPQHDKVVGVHRSDGSLVWLSVTALPRYDAGSTEPSGIVASFFDITERKAAQAAALESERQFRVLADSIPQLAWIAESDGSIHWYNQRWYEYTGTTPEQMADLNDWGWRHVNDPAHVDRVQAKYKEAIASQTPWEDTFPLRRHDGEYRWHLSRAMPLRDADGRVVRWFGTNTDVEDDRRHAAELRDAVQARDIFLSVASHELKTPLTPMALRLAQLKAETAKRAPEDVTHQRTVNGLTLVESQVRKLAGLVDGLLDVSRISQGNFSLTPADIDLAALLRDIVTSMEPQAEKVRSTLELHTPTQLPALVDAARVSQVVTNLLSNALKFGAGKPVTITLTADGDCACLVVRDSGIGVAEEHLVRIFDRFERAVSARHYGGMGLGLWLARQIVNAMGGSIRVESKPSEGATFTVEFPLVSPSTATP